MTKSKRSCVACILAVLLIVTLSVSVEAATLGVYYRPALTFLVENAPDDLVLHMDIERDCEIIPVYLYRETRLWESYFRLYRQTSPQVHPWYGNRADFENAVLVAETGGSETRFPIHEEMLWDLKMNSFLMLDLSDSSMNLGLPLWRTVLLFFLRLAITILAALLVLFFFRYRWKKSWISVLLINLICQSMLSLFLSNLINYNPKVIIILSMMIVTVLVIQIPLFWWLLDEKHSQKSVSYTFWSNVVTGILNFLFILQFPL